MGGHLYALLREIRWATFLRKKKNALTHHIYDLVQRDSKHNCDVVFDGQDWSAGFAVFEQKLRQHFVVIAIYRNDKSETTVVMQS